ncbi:thiolase domain-containing protein [Candidatus Bathyarchaeota archaeon]|nr:thiolase domain-containing protein [Candidatus Bathyarchaeota archaeon]
MTINQSKPIAAIVGAGRTKFGELWYDDPEKLLFDAGLNCMQSVDKGIHRNQLEACYFGSFLYQSTNKMGLVPGHMAKELGLNVPITMTEAACASGGSAIYNACMAIRSGQYDTVLVGGFEKMTDRSNKISDDLMFAADPNEFGAGYTFPGLYATMMARYMYDYGEGKQECEDAMAMVASKNHHHAIKNEYAQFRREFTPEAIKKSSLVAHPVRLLHCSPVSDGAAALILTTPEKAHTYTDTPIYILASQQATNDVSLYTRESITSIKTTKLATAAAFKETNLTYKDIQIAEVHDCFTVEEVMFLEDSGYYEKGTAWKGIYESYEAGKTKKHTPYINEQNELIVNPGGGLKADGHPVGATGVRQLHEAWVQLRGQAGGQQVESGLNTALCHNIGGTGAICTVHILGR